MNIQNKKLVLAAKLLVLAKQVLAEPVQRKLNIRNKSGKLIKPVAPEAVEPKQAVPKGATSTHYTCTYKNPSGGP